MSDKATQELAAIHLRLDAQQKRIMRIEKHQEKQQLSIAAVIKRYAQILKKLSRKKS